MKPKDHLIKLLLEENWESSESLLFKHKRENFFLEDVASNLASMGSIPTLPPALDWVMSQGVDPLYVNHGNGLFHDAITNGWDYEVVKGVMGVLKKYGCDIEYKIKPQSDPMDVAIATVMATMYPMDGGCELGQTPLLCAAKWGQAASLKVLLELGANPHAVDDQGFNFLDIYRVWMSKVANGDYDSKCLKVWLETDIGRQQMLAQMSNPVHQSTFLTYRTDFTQKWMAEYEKDILQESLRVSVVGTSSNRL